MCISLSILLVRIYLHSNTGCILLGKVPIEHSVEIGTASTELLLSAAEFHITTDKCHFIGDYWWCCALRHLKK